MNRFLPVACALLALGGCAAKPVAPVASAPASPVRAADWPRAGAAAAASGDPLEVRLVAYLRALAPGASAADIARVLVDSPEFPNRPVLEARYGAALAALGSDADADALCTTARPTGPEGLARCAAAARAAGDPARAGADAAAAWRAGAARDPLAERPFLAAFGAALSPADDRARFATLLAAGAGAREAARRAASRLPADDQPLALARLALAAGAVADPLALYASVPPPADIDPALVVGVARALRRGGPPDAALAFWREHGFAAERAAAAAGHQSSGFWTERDLLARALLDAGRPDDAFAVADDESASPEAARADAMFLAGWIALRKLGRPAIAATRFDALAALSGSIVTQARAAYWQARAAEAAGDAAAAHRHDLDAAAFPTTFYGQRALARLGGGADALGARLAAIPEPAPTQGEALGFATEEMPRAALLLAAWGEPRRARSFIDAADRAADAPPTRHVLAARLALRLGLPDEAVAIARRAGHQGIALPRLGWPRPYAPPPPAPTPLMLGLMRQESGFDPDAVSPSGALGLTQLLPGTAADMARASGRPAPSAVRLTADPSLNMQLGSAYLAMLLARFGAPPAAVAAYNSGPHRVSGWPACPSASPDDAATIDWIEAIPVAETRNYVERVLENAAIYASRPPTAAAEAALGTAPHA